MNNMDTMKKSYVFKKALNMLHDNWNGEPYDQFTCLLVIFAAKEMGYPIKKAEEFAQYYIDLCAPDKGRTPLKSIWFPSNEYRQRQKNELRQMLLTLAYLNALDEEKQLTDGEELHRFVVEHTLRKINHDH